MSGLRAQLVAAARHAIGLSAAPVEKRAPIAWDAARGKSVPDLRPPSAYHDLVWDSAVMYAGRTRADLVRVNGCALVVRGLLAQVGIRLALRDVTEWASGRHEVLDALRDAGALERDPTRFAAKLVPGNVLDFDTGSGAETSIRPHLAILLSVEPANVAALAVRTLDGGQREPDGSQCVRSKRTIFERAGVDDWRSSAGTLAGIGDVEALARAFGVGA